MKTRKILRVSSIVLLVAMVGYMGYNEVVVAQDENGDIANVSGFNTEQSITVILLGVGAGVLLAYQGYRTTSDDWDTLKFFDGVIMSVLGSIPLAIGAAATSTTLDVFGYVLIFFAALGIGQQISVTRRKTIPSNSA